MVKKKIIYNIIYVFLAKHRDEKEKKEKSKEETKIKEEPMTEEFETKVQAEVKHEIKMVLYCKYTIILYLFIRIFYFEWFFV